MGNKNKSLNLVYVNHSYEYWNLSTAYLTYIFGGKLGINTLKTTRIDFPWWIYIIHPKEMLLNIMKKITYKLARYIGPKLIKPIEKNASEKVKYRLKELYLSVIAHEEIKYNYLETNYQSSRLKLTMRQKIKILGLISIKSYGRYFSLVFNRNTRKCLGKKENINYCNSEDLLCSTQIRAAWRSGGDLKKASLHLKCIIQWNYLLNLPIESIKNKQDNNLILTTALESVYLDMVIPRRLAAKGIKKIEINTIDREPCIIDIDEKQTHLMTIKAKDVENFNMTDIANQKVIEYLNGRNIGKGLDYMKTNNRPTTSKDFVYRHVKKEYITLFLHSFADASYLHGTDCFSSIWEWTTNTIDYLSKQNLPVILKHHPGVGKYYYLKSDLVGIKKATEYAKKKINNLLVIKDELALIDLLEITKIGITHHGSICEELIFNGIPCIGSKAAPWTCLKIDGLYTYETIKEYKELIKSIPNIANKIINNADNLAMSSLYAYVYKTRIEPNESYTSHPLDTVHNNLENLINDPSWLSTNKLDRLRRVYKILFNASRKTKNYKQLYLHEEN